MKAFAVIGAGWGDECKGCAVDKISSIYPESIVVRHSSGAQAGHTVVTPEGKRHIFSHFGSGSFNGCPTYLTEHFVVNPRIFRIEMEELNALGIYPRVYVHPNCMVTTPFDVWVNRQLESMRGKDRHGSVGIGFGETIERSCRGPALRASASNEEAISVVWDIFHSWATDRLLELLIDDSEAIYNEYDWYEYGKDLDFFQNTVIFSDYIPKRESYIFEGAQGLLLDQKRGMEFPYLTRSNTGLQNVVPICEQAGIDKLKVVYMHRPYLNRHGAGPLPGESLWSSEKDNFNIVDETNVNGEWQGAPRYAPMDKPLLVNAICEDIKDAGNGIKIDYYSGRSCLDQVVKLGSACDLGIEPALYGFGRSRDKYEVENKFIRE